MPGRIGEAWVNFAHLSVLSGAFVPIRLGDSDLSLSSAELRFREFNTTSEADSELCFSLKLIGSSVYVRQRSRLCVWYIRPLLRRHSCGKHLQFQDTCFENPLLSEATPKEFRRFKNFFIVRVKLEKNSKGAQDVRSRSLRVIIESTSSFLRQYTTRMQT